jgi:hypothetical protein
MAMISFGAGTLKVIPKVGVESTFGILQDITVDISHTKKELYGEKEFPVDIARGQGKISIKVKSARIDSRLFNDILFQGNLVTTGTTTSVSVTNKPMGNSGTLWFQLELEGNYSGKTRILRFYKCSASKLGMSFKNDDYTIPDFDIDAVADENDRIYDWITKE